ncbi:MAG: hypothetical protein K5637_05905 [Lachnospiraceae bacterium]|nr:hypothetical protein [Lachnospiraceae bacterium]
MSSKKLFKQIAAVLIVSSFLTECFSPLKVQAAETVESDEEQVYETEKMEETSEQEYFYYPAEDPFIDNDAVLEPAGDENWEEDPVGDKVALTASEGDLSEEYSIIPARGSSQGYQLTAEPSPFPMITMTSTRERIRK